MTACFFIWRLRKEVQPVFSPGDPAAQKPMHAAADDLPSIPTKVPETVA